MGKRPRWYLWVLARIWKLSYIKPNVPLLGKFALKVRTAQVKPGKFNISHLPINAEVRPLNVPLPVVLLEDIIRKSSHRTIIRRCTCREAKNCQSYDMHLGCLHIGSATAEEDPNVAMHVSIEEAISHLHKAVESGLIPFMGHAAGDNTIWNVSADRSFLTVCFCCPCCCTLLIGYKYLPPESKDTFYRLKGISVSVDGDKCIGCGKCGEQCFTGAITIIQGKAVHDDSLCKGCGFCAVVCPQEAVEVKAEDLESTVLELYHRMSRQVEDFPSKLNLPGVKNISLNSSEGKEVGKNTEKHYNM